MSLEIVSETQHIAVSKGLFIDFYDSYNHIIIDVGSKTKSCETDYILDIVVSPDSKYLAVITSSKHLILFTSPWTDKHKSFLLPRTASKLRFMPNSTHVLIADKTGDVLIYDVNKDNDNGTKILGHLSLLLDVLLTTDEKYVITCDRDEKVRVTCYPNTYNIQTYCLGHKEFVNHIELLPHNDKYLTSTSGDGTIKCWDYVRGIMRYFIDVNQDVNCDEVETFVKTMDADGVEVDALPIVHYAVGKLVNDCSLLGVSVHLVNILFLYSLKFANNEFTHSLEHKLPLEEYPSSIKFNNLNMYIYNEVNATVRIFQILYQNGKVTLNLDKIIKMFENIASIVNFKTNSNESIKVLYKRKFDNVQEYQERKKQRLERSLK